MFFGIEAKMIDSFYNIYAFSYADTASEAIDLLYAEIIQVFENLLEDRNNSGTLPRKWLEDLEKIIECR